MPRRSFNPEKVVFLGPDAHGVTIEDDALIILGSPFTGRLGHESDLTPEQRYAANHAGILNEIAATYYSSPTLLTSTEIQEIKAGSPGLYERFQKAATRVLAQHGYFPPLPEMPAAQQAKKSEWQIVETTSAAFQEQSFLPDHANLEADYEPDYPQAA